MQRGIFLPIFDELANPALLCQLAVEAEQAGWDGVFLWDHVYYRPPVRSVTDAWAAMALIGAGTERVLFGPMVTPLARRRPHVLARQVAALDQLSGGRFVLGVGLGLDTSGGELSRFGEELDDRRRAAMLDEALGLLAGLLSGDEVSHAGGHYRAIDVQFRPAPTRLPIWVAARWPNRRPLRRAAAYDGVFIIDLATPGQLAEAVAVLAAERGGSLDGYEVVVQGGPDADPAAWAEAGATWWLTAFDPFTVTADEVRAAIQQVP